VLARGQTAPFRDRPSEGVFMVNVELGAMASPAFEAGGRPDDAAVELARVLERGLKQSGA
jgi:exosome complex RNA-binding protein Rrp42 (RNase PH superfamily)